MFTSWRLGRVAGIDLYLHPTFLLLVLATYLMGGGLIGMIFLLSVFACVLLHELGHALTARLYNIPTRDITLYPIGGVARLERMPRKAGPELLITLAGPATNLVIAGVIGLALAIAGPFASSGTSSLLASFLETLLMVNLALAAFNMIPAFPMDGGRIFRALLSGPLGRRRATEVAATVGQTLALVLPLVLLGLGSLSVLHVILAAFIFLAAGAERQQVRAEEADFSASVERPIADGIWIAPSGHGWVERGDGSWRAAPLVVPVLSDESRRRQASFRETAPWRIG